MQNYFFYYRGENLSWTILQWGRRGVPGSYRQNSSLSSISTSKGGLRELEDRAEPPGWHAELDIAGRDISTSLGHWKVVPPPKTSRERLKGGLVTLGHSVSHRVNFKRSQP